LTLGAVRRLRFVGAPIEDDCDNSPEALRGDGVGEPDGPQDVEYVFDIDIRDWNIADDGVGIGVD
jgi:hypothetical protein